MFGHKLSKIFLKIPFIKHTLLTYTYSNELTNIKKAIKNKCVQSQIKDLIHKHPLSFTKKDFKVLKFATHPDKCGSTDEFIAIKNFESKIKNTDTLYQDALKKINHSALETTKGLSNFNTGVKIIDVCIDMTRVLYQPTKEN